ncbi:hypothetical protein [Asaia prunellae]|uniref:hypothetical protein n=1 Tax=Asaia prunellae TaxID=610245 RepID=UPI00047057F1|nr:hypothetical protein [Asaia prunellae]
MRKFKVGDRVKAVDSFRLLSKHVGKCGRVQNVGEYFIDVAFDDGAYDDGRLTDFEFLHPAVNTEALKADLMAAVEAGEGASVWDTLGSHAKPAFAKELLEKHFNLVRVPASAAKWVEKESAA